ncbi:LADA_0G09912g1_1 [Lachancea dasiensis]|uniref:ATP-dependent DNA helicase II subunit 2 n=1 Tax=Lachancea dasiensis TaxID=1072105 RepID=A0A1G4JUY4_9SACH|nr:LADA_0G09912g1_1 [Lachancea dasiensis]
MGSEATTFILDVSPSMIGSGFADQALAYLEYVMFMKAKKQRKTDWVKCYLANCALTRNNHETDNVYELLPFTAPISAGRIVAALQELEQILSEETKPQSNVNSMVQSLLISSMSARDTFQKRKVRKQVIVFTNDLEGLDLTEEELHTLEQELDSRIILAVCGQQEGSRKQDSTIWEKCINAIPGSMQVSMANLLQEITTPAPPTVKPVRVFQGELRLGAPITDSDYSKESYDSIAIRVEGYPATKSVSSLNRQVVSKTKENEYEPVKSVIEYEAFDRDDEEERDSSGHNDGPDSNADKHELRTVSVAQESVTKAYRYGSDYVVLPQTIEAERIYHTTSGIDIRGFISREDVPRHYLNSESTFIVPATKDGTSADSFALAALVDAMIRLEKLAIVRYVQRTDSEVQMCTLCPLLVLKKRKSSGDTDFQTRALVLSRLPFAEDERVSDYPKLNNSDAQNNEITAEIDTLMEDFVESRSIGGGPATSWCSTSLYQPVDAVVSADPSLPLPGLSGSREVDVWTVPAIGIHRQQQLLIEYMHQKVVRGSTTFDIPELPALYQDLLHPSHVGVKESQKRLQELLDIKLNTSKTTNDQRRDEQHEDDGYQDIPSLESLLRRGRA